ncbi:MAG: hypothetical protein PHG06_05405 [Parabacteroides sp.]|nr:hypothetical protein [Parabacteroides sp.]MEA4839667.1 hypothetical protein [Bacteroidales bacterium]
MKHLFKLIRVLLISVSIAGCSKTMDDYPSANLRAISAFEFEYYHNSDCNIHILHEGEVDETNRIITISVPTDADLTHLRPTITLSPWTTCSPKTLEAMDFTSPVDYTVTAQSGKIAVYTVHVTTEYIYKNADLFRFYLLDITNDNGEPMYVTNNVYNDGAVINVKVPKGTDISSQHTHLSLSPASMRATLEICESGNDVNYKTFTDGDAVDYRIAPVIFRITAEGGLVNRYKINVTEVEDGNE